MQSYPLAVKQAEAATIQAQGDYFVYESASTGTDTRILVKPDNGSEIILKPGQRFRIKNLAGSWTVKTYDGVSIIAGALVIGEGEFEDSNVTTLSALSSAVITNTVAQPIPVAIQNGQVEITNDLGNRLPVSLDLTQTLNVAVAGQTVNYTNAFNDSGTASTSALVVFTPAANVNGAYIEFAEIGGVNIGTGNMEVRLIAKSSAPANSADGDVVMLTVLGGLSASSTSGYPTVNDKLPVRIKIAAGKGLYINQNGSPAITVCSKTILYTLL